MGLLKKGEGKAQNEVFEKKTATEYGFMRIKGGY